MLNSVTYAAKNRKSASMRGFTSTTRYLVALVLVVLTEIVGCRFWQDKRQVVRNVLIASNAQMISPKLGVVKFCALRNFPFLFAIRQSLTVFGLDSFGICVGPPP